MHSQAHRLSTPDALSSPATTTTPDDVFYILKVVLTRLISTGSPRALERTSVLLRDVIERDYAGTIKRKMDDVYRTAGAMRGEKAERESRLAFIVCLFCTFYKYLQCIDLTHESIQTLLNDLDISSSHMERLIKDLVSAPTISQGFLIEEAPIAKSSISAFNNLVPKFRSVLRVRSVYPFVHFRLICLDLTSVVGLFSLASNSSSTNSSVPRCAPSSPTCTRTCRTSLMRRPTTSRSIKTSCGNGSLRHGKASWKGTRCAYTFAIVSYLTLIWSYQDTFTEGNFRLFFGLALDILIRPWEKYIMSIRYSEVQSTHTTPFS